MRHSAYYDFGAQHRIEILETLGLTINVLKTDNFGPILFREECVFRKEIGLSDTIFIHTKISKMRPDASRWSIVHEFKNEDDKLCATITVDGAWMDTKLRKIANPTPAIAMEAMNSIPRTEDFMAL
jgi:acyl-CoA thioester hydrolase